MITYQLLCDIFELIRDKSMEEYSSLDGFLRVGVLVFSKENCDWFRWLTNWTDFGELLLLPQSGWWILKSPPIIM